MSLCKFHCALLYVTWWELNYVECCEIGGACYVLRGDYMHQTSINGGKMILKKTIIQKWKENEKTFKSDKKWKKYFVNENENRIKNEINAVR